jgi:hypothetical protein
MRALRPLLLFGILLPAAVPVAASAAALRAEAHAVIRSGIALRTAASTAGPGIEAPTVALMPARIVVRPCRTGEAAPAEQCRFVLVEVQ